MNNLRLCYQKTLKYDGIKANLFVQHPYENISFVYYNGIIKSIDHNNKEVKELCVYDGIIAMDYIQINDCICFATENGEIVQYNLNDANFEVVGLISDGIKTMQWSPDQEHIVFITKTYNMILMFSCFEVFTESSLHDKAAKEFLTVGWGKKETQFHGSAGKDSRKKDEIEIQDIEKLDKTITCCWRADGEYYAVNFVGANGRMFKVYNKEGDLEYVSEICANLQVPMAWRPTGLWIAKPEIYPKTNKYTITLFEKNGLKHNEIPLPYDHESEQVINLCWSQDSDILLIETIRDKLHVLYFYTICNYHWYLKYYEEFNTSLKYVWSENFLEKKLLHLIDENGSYKTYKFDFIVNHSNGKSDIDESIVAVIDDRKIKLTNFRSQMVPPPMSSLDVTTDTRVNLIEFLQTGDTNSFLTVDHSHKISFYRCIFIEAVNGKKLQEVEKIKEVSFGFKVIHCMWLNEKEIIVVNDNSVLHYNIDNGSENVIKATDTIVSFGIATEGIFYIELINGSVLTNNFSNNSELSRFTHPEISQKIISVSESSFYSLKPLKRKLYHNNKEIATEVTSMAATHDHEFLLFTTIGELKFIRVAKNPSEIVETRRIERGSKIVTLVKDKAQVILQLPRGNLETISPRILSLRIIQKHLELSNYRLAFDILRKERINLNLLIDLNPPKFLTELQDFVLKIDNINWLNLFLTELKNEDVTVTMYKFCETSPKNSIEGYSVDKKSSFVCEKILKIFQKLDSKKYLLPSITCHVKNESFENALEMIWNLKKTNTADKEADDALKYLLYLIDINVLYNIALGMYDYQLVMYVAQKSQKDPKEYVPFLQQLSKLDQSYAKFKIDCYLKRYPRAVGNIVPLCESDDEKLKECIELVKKHELYEAAMAAFANDSKCYKKMCNLFGDHLRVKGKLAEASLMYERGNDYKQALSSATYEYDWKRCLILAKKSGYNENQLKNLARKLILNLNDTIRYKESSEIIKMFFSDDKKLLVESLADAHLYNEALLESSMSGNDEFIESIIKPKLNKHLTEKIDGISYSLESFLSKKERLLEVRQEKLKKLLNPEEEGDHDDMFSDTTSIVSQNSRNTSKTFRSSKNKRKYEKKLTNLKQGNRFEDIALLDSLWSLIHRIIAVENQNSIKDLIKNGIEFNLDEQARKLQKSFKDLLFTIKNSLDVIWVDDLLKAGKYPETDAEMEAFDLLNTDSYTLVKPEQRFKPKLNVIDFEMEIFRESYTNKKN